MSSSKRTRRATQKRRILDDEAEEYLPSEDELQRDREAHSNQDVPSADSKEEIDPTVSSPQLDVPL